MWHQGAITTGLCALSPPPATLNVNLSWGAVSNPHLSTLLSLSRQVTGLRRSMWMPFLICPCQAAELPPGWWKETVIKAAAMKPTGIPLTLVRGDMTQSPNRGHSYCLQPSRYCLPFRKGQFLFFFQSKRKFKPWKRHVSRDEGSTNTSKTKSPLQELLK